MHARKIESGQVVRNGKRRVEDLCVSIGRRDSNCYGSRLSSQTRLVVAPVDDLGHFATRRQACHPALAEEAMVLNVQRALGRGDVVEGDVEAFYGEQGFGAFGPFNHTDAVGAVEQVFVA